MPIPYNVWLHQAAYDYLETLDMDERQRLLVWLERLGRQPSLSGDFAEKGRDGRKWQVIVLASHAIVWWVDSPVREIKVVAIRPADI